MRISELSRRSGVSVATIKYYIREDLLPSGRPTAATQAEYDDQHLRRLRLVRALIGVRGLSVNTTRGVLRALSEETADIHRILGIALGAVRLAGDTVERPEGSAGVDSLIRELGWQVHETAPARATLVDTLATLQDLGVDIGWHALLPYARLAEQTAILDLEQLRGVDDPLELAERAVLLSILLDPALMALRQLAQEHESAKRHGG